MCWFDIRPWPEIKSWLLWYSVYKRWWFLFPSSENLSDFFISGVSVTITSFITTSYIRLSLILPSAEFFIDTSVFSILHGSPNTSLVAIHASVIVVKGMSSLTQPLWNFGGQWLTLSPMLVKWHPRYWTLFYLVKVSTYLSIFLSMIRP